MNNTQLYLAIGVPSFLVILTWASNTISINRLADRVDRNGELLRAEMNDFRREIHSDIVPLHERMAVVETKQK